MKYSLLKRISAFVLAFALVMTTAFNAVGTTQANAAKKATVSAKGATVTVGASKSIKVSIKCKAKAKATIKVAVVKGATGKVTKKVTNSNAKKAAKTCKSTIKVTGKKAGKVKLSITPYINGKKAGKAKKITVTVKAKATTAAPATTAASSDAPVVVTTEAPVTTENVVTTEAAASSNPLKKVELSNKAPKVGDVVKAILDPVNATDVKSYAWFVGAVEVSGEATASYTVKKEDLTKTIKVVVTTVSDTKIESNESAAVIEDNSGNILLTDLDGLQSDGTALTTDTLEVSYGSSLGTPKTITWYINDQQVTTVTTNSGAISTAEKQFMSAAQGSKTGNCYAVITNEVGQQYKSDSVTIVAKELGAKLTDFKLTDTKSTLAAKTKDLVASVTLNKYYKGTFYIVNENVKEFTTGNTNNAAGVVFDLTAKHGAAPGAPDWVTYTDPAQFTTGNLEKVIAADPAVKGIAYLAGDNTASVMFVADTDADRELVRGSKYALAFDQTNVTTDTFMPKASDTTKTPNLTSYVEAAYVTAPGAVVIKNVDSDITQPGSVTAGLFASSDAKDVVKLTTFSSSKFTAGGANFSLTYYKNKKHNNTDGAAFETQGNGIIKDGVDTSVNQCTSDKTACVSVYAVFEADAGIFGKEKLKLTSAYKRIPVADAGTLKVSSSSKDVKDIVVDILGQQCDGTVYLLYSKARRRNIAPGYAYEESSKKYFRDNNGDGILNGADAYENDIDVAAPQNLVDDELAQMVADFNENNKTTYIQSGKVTLAQNQITFDDVISKIGNETVTDGDFFAAVFIPDAEGFARSKTISEATGGLNLTQKATVYELDGASKAAIGKITVNNGADDTAATGDDVIRNGLVCTLKIKDQFGQPMNATADQDLGLNKGETPKTTAYYPGVALVKVNDDADDSATPKLIVENGKVFVTFTKAATITTGDKFTFTTKYGKFTLTIDEGTTVADATSGKISVSLS